MTVHYYSGMEACGHESDKAGYACIRASITGLGALITFLFCCVRLVTLVRMWHSESTDDRKRVFSYMFIFVAAFIMTGMMSYKWIYWAEVEIHFAFLYLQVIIYLVLCIFYSRLALQSIGKEVFVVRVVWPAAVVILLAFTVVLVVAIDNKQDNAVECKDWSWLLFSSSTVVLSIIFFVAGIILTRAMAKFPTFDKNLIWKEKFNLWMLIIAYTITSLTGFCFDLVYYAKTKRDSNAHCDLVFGNAVSLGYTIYKIFDRIALLLPTWVMLGVLRLKPKVVASTDQSMISEWATPGSQDSESSFDPQSLQPIADLGDLSQSYDNRHGEDSPLLGTSYPNPYPNT